MKVWRFYYIKKREDTEENDYQLYAITNKKEYAKEFMKTRNMKKFIYNSSNLEMDEWRDFANDNRGAVLDIYTYEARRELPNGFYGTKPVNVLSTFTEYQNCSEEESYDLGIFEEEFFYQIPHYKIFKKHVINTLELLQYTAVYDLFAGIGNPREINPDDLSVPDFKIDEFNLFVRLYKETLTE